MFDDRIRTSITSRRRALALALVLALAFGAGAAGCGNSDSAGGADDPLPKAALTDLTTGEPAAWPATGTPTVINFWASWCAPCRQEMPAFDRVDQKLDGKVAIVGVTDEDDLTAARKAADAAGVGYPLLVDEDQRLLIDLGISGLPGTVFVDAEGNVVGTHLGALTEDELANEIEDRYGIET